MAAREKNMEQLKEFRKKYPDALFMWRTGDSYEMYGRDAEALEVVCGCRAMLDLATKKCFASFAKSALDDYLPKLVKRGYRVAIVDKL